MKKVGYVMMTPEGLYLNVIRIQRHGGLERVEVRAVGNLEAASIFPTENLSDKDRREFDEVGDVNLDNVIAVRAWTKRIVRLGQEE